MESISRISNLLESARELTLDASSAARSTFRGPAARPLDGRQIKKLLDSRNEREILDGLRRVIAMAYARNQQKTLPFFSAVVKNVASPNLEIKKLVYIYVVLHAEQEPDMALLSINTIQKSLSDANPQVRALALRTMSGIRVPVISQIVSLAIRKGTADMSSYVRRAAALAIPKCFRLDPTLQPQLLEHMAVLLRDKEHYVAGAAVTAFMAVCPDRIDLIHPHYRDLVRKLVDMDEWSQLATLRMMTLYARRCFPQRTKTVAVSAAGTTSNTARHSLGDFYGDEPEDGVDTEATEPTASPGGETKMQTVPVLDPDLVLLLNAIRPLLQSRNAGVVVAVARCYVSAGTPAYVRDAVGPLVALLRGPQDIQQIALYNIAAVCLVQPADFVRYASRFLVRASDPPAVWRLKLEVLALVFPHSPAHTKSLILSELEHFARGAARDKALVKEAVRAIGRCAQAAGDAATSARCLRLLLAQITSLDGTLAAESLTVIRHLIQQEPSAAIHKAIVVRLAKNLDAATDAQARATIVWLVGEFSGLGNEDGDNIAADVLRILLKDFANESEAAKRQILLLAAKVYLHHVNQKDKEEKTNGENGEKANGENGDTSDTGERDRITPLWEYVLLLVRYDVSYDLRDRARLYRALLAVPQLATLMLLAPKPVPHAPSPSEARRGFTLGSAALVLGQGGESKAKNMLHGIRGYESLPDWVRDGDEPDAALRDTEEEKKAEAATTFINRKQAPAGDSLDQAARSRGPIAAAGAGAAGGKLGSKTLDDWLAEEEEESSEEEGSEESSSEESSEEEEEESDDEDDEEGEEEGEEEGSEEDEEESEDEDSDAGEADRLVRT